MVFWTLLNAKARSVLSYLLTYLSGSRGNRKNAKSDCVLFRVQFGAAQKFGMLQVSLANLAAYCHPRTSVVFL